MESWVAIRKRDGHVIGEFYNRKNVERFNPEKVTVIHKPMKVATCS